MHLRAKHGLFEAGADPVGKFRRGVFQ